MSTNNQHNLRCGFEEQLVSYVYDEIGASEKSNFEKHLDGCKSCIDEFSSFGLVRSSIDEWKTIEFAELNVPSISIPELESAPMRSFVALKNDRSRFYWIGDLFSIAPNWATAASIAVVLMLFVGITFIVINISNSPEVSNNGDSVNPVAPKRLVVTDSVNEPIDENQITDNVTDNPKPELVKETVPESINNKKPTKKRESAVAAYRSKKIRSGNKPTNNPSDATIANSNDRFSPVRRSGEIPKLTNFDVDEDDSLRLSDLFDDIGSR